MNTSRLRTITTALIALSALLWTVVGAAAQSGAGVSVEIRDSTLERDGDTQLIVSVTGDAVPDVLAADAFTISEDGTPVDGVSVEPILESQEESVSVVLLVDVSGSTAGEPLDEAKRAAQAFVSDLEGARVALVAFGETAAVVVPLTADTGRVLTGLGGLEAGGETALYDGVVLAASLLGDDDTIERVIAFSDGDDTVSTASEDEAVAAVTDAGGSLTSVILTTPDLDVASLERLADRTGGRALPVADAGALGEAFEAIAREIASQYVLTYSSATAEPEELPISVAVAAGGESGRAEVTVLNVRDPVTPPDVVPSLPPVTVAQPLIPEFGSATGRSIGIGAAGLAALLLLLVVLWRPGRTEASESLSRTMRMYDRSGRERRLHRPAPTQRVTESLVGLVGRLPKPAGAEERLQAKLDRADWPMRANEFLVLSGAAAALGAIVLPALTGSALMLVVGAFVGGAVPSAILARRVDKRQKAFMEQLPGLLQLLAGSLEAGYGLLQAIDTVVKESDPPASTEFSRALTEARLGMPLEDALDNMAERLDNQDFRWVVIAINVQRQVGGNLAHLLSTVAATVRERQQVRRQVRALSAEGRISATIVGLMPLVVVLMMSITSPDYLPAFFATTVGQIAGIVGVVLLAIGMLWLRRMVRIEL